MYSLFQYKYKGAPISSLSVLCDTLKIDRAQLERAMALSVDERYEELTVKKKNGGNRVVQKVIDRQLNHIQRCIKNQILANQNLIQWPIYVYGSLPTQRKSDPDYAQRDHHACAARHLNSRSLLTADIKDFFDHVDSEHLQEVFQGFMGYSEEVTAALINLCCKEQALIQGASTSSYLANLALFDIEPKLAQRLYRKNLTYTRLVDDITVSSKKAGYDFTYAKEIVFEALRDKGFMPNVDKVLERAEGSAPLTVHGLRIDYGQVRLPSDEPKRIRAHVKSLEDAASGSYKYRTSYLYSKEYARCLGRVYKLKRVNHSQHEALLKRLKAVAPLPSQSEQDQCLERLAVLQQLQVEGKGSSEKFKKKYYVLIERLGVLQKSFPVVATRIRAQLKGMRPPTGKGRV